MFVLLAKAGVSVPALTVKLFKVAFVDNRVTVMVYVLVVVPFWAVTTTAIVFGPGFSAIGADAVPEVTDVALTRIVEPALLAVGVTVILVVAPATLAA